MSEPKDAGGLVVGERIETKCCACGGGVIFKVAESDDENPVFFHTMPYCKRFEDTNTIDDLITYMRACVNSQKGN